MAAPKPAADPAETMLAALRTVLISGVLQERGALWKIVDNAIRQGELIVAPPVAPAVAAKWLAAQRVTLAEVRTDRRLTERLAGLLRAHGFDLARMPRDLNAVRDELAALIQESML